MICARCDDEAVGLYGAGGEALCLAHRPRDGRGYWKSSTDRHVPDGYEKILDADVFVSVDRSEIVVLGAPPNPGPHNCDEMGCGSFSHCLVRGQVTLPTEVHEGTEG